MGVLIGWYAHRDLNVSVAEVLRRHNDLMQRSEWLMDALERAGLMKWTRGADGKISGALVEATGAIVVTTSMIARGRVTTERSDPGQAEVE